MTRFSNILLNGGSLALGVTAYETGGSPKTRDTAKTFEANDPVVFQFGEQGKVYGLEQQKNFEKPFAFPDNSDEPQHCLLMDDADLANVRAAAMSVAFPTMANTARPDIMPLNGKQVIRNAMRIFDDHSEMYIHGVGEYKGPVHIGNYLAVPHPNVSNVTATTPMAKYAENGTHITYIDRNTLSFRIARLELWAHRNATHFLDADFSIDDSVEPQLAIWHSDIEFYPCSAMIKKITLKFPDDTLTAFVEAGDNTTAVGSHERFCTKIMNDCQLEHQQYANITDCIEYVSQLPHIDPACQAKYGAQAVQGNSFMCKFLHHFMAPTSPEEHCYHAGKGLYDSHGHRKCVPSDCLTDSITRDDVVSLADNQSTFDTFYQFNQSSNQWIETVATPQTMNFGVGNLSSPRSIVDEQATRLSTCGDEDENMLAAATVYALKMCVSSLTTIGSSCSPVCTRAINHYFGRLVENGAFCRCCNRSDDYVTRKSAVLNVLNLDPLVLLDRCPPTEFENPPCSGFCRHGEASSRLEMCPLQSYASRVGCREWDYSKIGMALEKDWSPNAQLHGRITTHEAVATAEMDFFAQMETWAADGALINVTNMNAWVAKPLPITSRNPGFRADLDPSPSYKLFPDINGSRRTRHQEVVAAMQDENQPRDPSQAPVFFPWLYGSDDLDRTGTLTVGQSTGTDMHTAERNLTRLVAPGMNHSGAVTLEELTSLVSQEIKRRGVDVRTLSLWDRDDLEILKHILSVVFPRAIFNSTSDQYFEEWVDIFENFNQKIGGSISAGPRSLHRIHGEQLSTTHLSFRAQAVQFFKKIIPPSTMGGYVCNDTNWWDARRVILHAGQTEPIGTENSCDVETDFDAAYHHMFQLLFSIAALPTVTTEFMTRLVRDECTIAPLLDQHGTTKVFLEHLRLTNFVPAFISNSTAYSWLDANLDPEVFEQPLVFDPGRRDLGKAVTFNGLEEDFDPQFYYRSADDADRPTTLHRGCPARNLAINWITTIVPLFLPTDYGQQCKTGHRIHDGVSFHSRLLEADPGVHVEILEASGAGIPSANQPSEVPKVHASRLMLLLASIAEPASWWGDVIARMQVYLSSMPLPSGHTLNTEPQDGGNMHYWAVNPPGQGFGTPLANCSMKYASRLLINVIRTAKEDYGYDQVYFVGRGGGGFLGWAVVYEAEMFDGLLDGFITSAPHPMAYAGSKDKPFSASTIFFTVDPILSSNLFAASPDILRWFTNQEFDDWRVVKSDHTDTDVFPGNSELAGHRKRIHNDRFWDARRFLQQHGPNAALCYERDNFDSHGAYFAWKDSVYFAQLTTKYTPVKLLYYLIDSVGNPKGSHFNSVPFLTYEHGSSGRLLDFASMRGREFAGSLVDVDQVDELAFEISNFVQKLNAPFSVWKLVTEPNFPHKLKHLTLPMGTTGTACVVFCILLVLAGLQLELLIGPMTLAKGSRKLYRFCKIFSTVVFYTTLAAGEVSMAVLIPFMVIAVFDFGYPQVRALISRPFRRVGPDVTDFQRWRSFCDGVGTIIHHSGGFLVVSAVVTHRTPGLLYLFPGLPIMIEHILVSFNIFRASTHVGFKIGLTMFLLVMEVWLYSEVMYLWVHADVMGAIGSTMIASGHVIWLCMAIAEHIMSMCVLFAIRKEPAAVMIERSVEARAQSAARGRRSPMPLVPAVEDPKVHHGRLTNTRF